MSENKIGFYGEFPHKFRCGMEDGVFKMEQLNAAGRLLAIHTMNLKDEAIRDALRGIGWTPPGESDRVRPLVWKEMSDPTRPGRKMWISDTPLGQIRVFPNPEVPVTEKTWMAIMPWNNDSGFQVVMWSPIKEGFDGLMKKVEKAWGERVRALFLEPGVPVRGDSLADLIRWEKTGYHEWRGYMDHARGAISCYRVRLLRLNVWVVDVMFENGEKDMAVHSGPSDDECKAWCERQPIGEA